MTAAYPIALATLEVDENLKQMRFDLVPKQYEFSLDLKIVDKKILYLELMKNRFGEIIFIVLV
jgi:hypothetical protein